MYPKDVLQWTSTNVHHFLLDKKLNQMVPVCRQMDGCKLIELYRLCCHDSPVMLHTLRSETMELHSSQLSTYVYLSFLSEMRNLMPEDNSNTRKTHKSQICILL